MKICDKCNKKIKDLDFIQLTFMGRTQSIPMFFKKPIQLEFCSLNCFQEFFVIFSEERFRDEERRRQENEDRGVMEA